MKRRRLLNRLMLWLFPMLVWPCYGQAKLICIAQTPNGQIAITTCPAAIPGPQGPQGVPGAVGPQGPIGPAGPQGAAGTEILTVVTIASLGPGVLYMPMADGINCVPIMSTPGTVAVAATIQDPKGVLQPVMAFEKTPSGVIWHPLIKNPSTADGQPMRLTNP